MRSRRCRRWDVVPADEVRGEPGVHPVGDGGRGRVDRGRSGLADESGGWLADVNALRAAGPSTYLNLATGLPSLTDPGTDSGRVSLMFRERAFWLFGTGTRLGDLRRLDPAVRAGSEHGVPDGAVRADASEPTADADPELWDGCGSDAADASERYPDHQPEVQGAASRRRRRREGRGGRGSDDKHGSPAGDDPSSPPWPPFSSQGREERGE